jgi:hypothetical protein
MVCEDLSRRTDFLRQSYVYLHGGPAVSACIEGRLEIAKWLYNKSASLGLELEVPANYSPLVEEWIGD